MGRAQQNLRYRVERPEVGEAVLGEAVLTVDLVMARYHLRDRRSARRLMDEAGSFRIGASLYVRLEDLEAFEEARKAARRSSVKPTRTPAMRSQPAARIEPLAPGWWRTS